MSKKWWEFWRSEAKHFSPSYIQSVIVRGSATWSAYSYIAFVDEGYRRNPTVYACIDAKQTAAQSLPIILKDAQGQPIENHPILQWLQRPNPYQTLQQVIAESIANYDLAGEANFAKIGMRNQLELISLRPDWLIIESYDQDTGMPLRYRYSPSEQGSSPSVPYLRDELIIWARFNPLDRWRGLSPLHACAFAIDTLNSYASSNKSTLDNGVTPSGVLSTATTLEDESFKRLQTQFTEKYSGANNTGKPMLLEGGLTWQQTGLSPRDMEYIQGKRANELDVCKALRVPPQIIGIDGSQTFANYEQARAAFYEDTVIPTVNSLLSQISYSIAADFSLPRGAYLCVDVDAVAALEPRRAERMKVIDNLQSISVNEKREGMGYGETDGGDVVLIDGAKIPLDMAGVDPVSSTGNY